MGRRWLCKTTGIDLLLLSLLLFSFAIGNATAEMPQWSDVGREISLGLYLAAKNDAEKIATPTRYERDRKTLVLAFLDKRLKKKEWWRCLEEIPRSSPYRHAADLMLREQVMVPESITGARRRLSPFMRKFYNLWRKDRKRALKLLLWSPDITEKRRAVRIAFNRLFYEGKNDMVIVAFRCFRSLHVSVSNLQKVALAHWREGEMKEALSLLDQALGRSPGNRELLFWKATTLRRLGRLGESVELMRQVAKDMGGGFYPWYSRMLLGLVKFRGERCQGEGAYPDPVLYAMEESGLIMLGRKILKDKVLVLEHPDLLRDSQIYPYQSLRLSYLQSENGEFCVRYPRPWRKLVQKFCGLYGIQREMLYALIHTESTFDRFSCSRSKARGLTQVLPSTGRWIAKQQGRGHRFYPNQGFIPFFSIQFGSWYLHYLDQEFQNQWPLVVASYNGGPGRTRRWLKEYPDPTLEEVAVFYPLAQTRKYVKRLFVYQFRYLGASALRE